MPSKNLPITDLSQLDLSQTYTYADYLQWQVRERIELLKGKIHLMSPAPSMKHQRISRNLSGILWSGFKDKTCEVFTAPFDVRLPQNNQPPMPETPIYTVVQPDLCVVCDPAKLDEQGCLGAPDLVVKITPPRQFPQGIGRQIPPLRSRRGEGVLGYFSPRPLRVAICDR